MKIFLNNKEIKLTFLLDDTIDILKLKIEEQLEIDYNDIYLYVKKYKSFNNDLFDVLRKNNPDILFKDIYPFLSNIDIEFDEIDYKYEDFLSLHLTKSHLVNIPLGHNYKYFIVDPHHKYAKSLTIKDPPIITNQNVILEYLPFEELHIVTRSKIPYDIRSYYFVSEKPNIKIPSIDYLYDEPKEKINQYISSISCKINSICKFIPIDIVFKNLHASESIPFIKYNPGPLREKIFRLYGTQLSTQHNIIPMLTKSNVNNYDKELAKSTMISMVIKENYEIILNLFEDGSITFIIRNIIIDHFKDIEMKLKEYINPIIYNINSMITTNGYIYPIINEVEDLIINGITYNAVLNTNKDMIPYLKCMSSIFYFGEDEFLYKRISNFNIKGAIQKFIAKYSGINEEHIVDLLVKQKGLSESEARQEIKIFKIQRQIEEGLFKMILNQQPNPGFPLHLTEDENENTVITISDINHLEYLKIIPVYINGLYLMALNKMNSQQKDMLCEYKQETVKQQTTTYHNTTKKILELDFSDDELSESDDSDISDDSDSDLEIEFEDDFYDGGNVKIKNITSDSYAQDRLMKRDPDLFLKQKQGNYLAYSRFCQSHKDRQPMILTNDEMEEIKKNFQIQILEMY